jgi:hypothetical protein
MVAGDMDVVAGDFSEVLRPHLLQIASALPQPTTAAEVISVEFADYEAVAMITYSGENGALTVPPGVARDQRTSADRGRCTGLTPDRPARASGARACRRQVPVSGVRPKLASAEGR